MVKEQARNKRFNKKGQIGHTLTWFVAFLIIFFIMIVFVVFTSIIAARNYSEGKPSFVSSSSLPIYPANSLSFSPSFYTFIEKDNAKVKNDIFDYVNTQNKDNFDKLNKDFSEFLSNSDSCKYFNFFYNGKTFTTLSLFFSIPTQKTTFGDVTSYKSNSDMTHLVYVDSIESNVLESSLQLSKDYGYRIYYLYSTKGLIKVIIYGQKC